MDSGSRGRSVGRGGSTVRSISVGVIARSASSRGRSVGGCRGRRARSVTRARSVGAAAKSDLARGKDGSDKGDRSKSLDRGDYDFVQVLGSPHLTVCRLHKTAGAIDKLYGPVPNQNSWIDLSLGQIGLDVWGAAGDNAAGDCAAGDCAAGDNAGGDNDPGENAAGENAAGEKWNEDQCSGDMFNF